MKVLLLSVRKDNEKGREYGTYVTGSAPKDGATRGIAWAQICNKQVPVGTFDKFPHLPATADIEQDSRRDKSGTEYLIVVGCEPVQAAPAAGLKMATA